MHVLAIYFVQILLIRSKCQEGQRWSRGGGEKNSREEAAPSVPILPALCALV